MATRYRDPDTGKFISREEYLELQADERGDVDDWDDFEDFREFDEEEYMGEGA
jgi:hypothetical protein